MAPDAAELVDAGSRADVHAVFHRHVPAERGHVPEDGVVSHMAVVGHVHVGHEDVPVADRGPAPAALGSTVNGDELAEDVPAADRQTRLFAAELEILRRLAD